VDPSLIRVGLDAVFLRQRQQGVCGEASGRDVVAAAFKNGPKKERSRDGCDMREFVGTSDCLLDMLTGPFEVAQVPFRQCKKGGGSRVTGQKPRFSVSFGDVFAQRLLEES